MKLVMVVVVALLAQFGLLSGAQGGPVAVGSPNPATSAVDMNKRVNEITGLGWGDSFRTVALPDGRWLSVVADNADFGQPFPVRDNAFVLWDAVKQWRVETSLPLGNAMPRWSDGSEFWPYVPVVVSNSIKTTRVARPEITMYVLGERIRVLNGTDWQPMGAWIAVVRVPWGGNPTFVRYLSTPSSGSDNKVVQWYGAMAYHEGFMYIHGVKDRPEAFHSRDGGYVARVPAQRLDRLDLWRFWDGDSWVADESAAVPTIPVWGNGSDGTESNYTLHRRPDGAWAVTTKYGGTIAENYGRYVAANPWGPWTWEQLGSACSVNCYMAGAVEQVPLSSGKLLVLYNTLNGNPVFAEVNP